MRATKHTASQGRRGRGQGRGRGPVTGIPLVLLAVCALACLAVAFLPGSPASTGRAVAAGRSGVVPGTGSPATSGGASVTASAARLSASRAPSPSGSRVATVGTVVPRAAPLAGRIKPSVTYHGVATAYAAGDGNGSCLFGPSNDLMIAAMNYTDYETARACGAYVLVRAANGASLTVRIVNECPLPCAPGQLDLSQQAFARLAHLSVGRLPITWTLLSPASPGTIFLRYKTGSTRWWCGIQVIGHRNPVAMLEVRSASGWRRLPRTDYNYFLSADGTGCGGAIRITDIYGQRLTVGGIALRPDVAQSTGLQFTRH